MQLETCNSRRLLIRKTPCRHAQFTEGGFAEVVVHKNKKLSVAEWVAVIQQGKLSKGGKGSGKGKSKSPEGKGGKDL